MITSSRILGYREMLLALLPPGRAWNRQPDSVLAKLFEALGVELAQVEQRGEELIAECDPRTTAELLTDWERMLGLPDECTGPLDSLTLRRNAILIRLAEIGGQSISYFVALAARLGIPITITEFDAFQIGLPVGLPLNGVDWEFAFQVNAPAVTVTPFTVGASGAGDPLATWGNELLECAIERAKPAHTIPIFAYA